MRGGLGEDFGMIGVKSELNGDPMDVGLNGKGVYSSYIRLGWVYISVPVLIELLCRDI